MQSDQALTNEINYLTNLKKRKAEETELLNILKEEQQWRERKVQKEKEETEYARQAATMTTQQLREQLKTLREAQTIEESNPRLQYVLRTEIEKRDAEEAEIQKELLAEYNKAVEAKQKELAIRKEAGVEIEKEDELQQMLNAKLNAYVTYIKMVEKLPHRLQKTFVKI